MPTIIPAQYIGPPKGNGDQNAQHSCCKWSNASNEEDDTTYKSHNISPLQQCHWLQLLLFEGTEDLAFVVQLPQHQQKLKNHNETLLLVDMDSLERCLDHLMKWEREPQGPRNIGCEIILWQYYKRTVKKIKENQHLNNEMLSPFIKTAVNFNY